MDHITDADREAARALREVLGEISGFWHRTDDLSPICLALAHHRIAAQQEIMRHLMPSAADANGSQAASLRTGVAGNCSTLHDARGQEIRSHLALS